MTTAADIAIAVSRRARLAVLTVLAAGALKIASGLAAQAAPSPDEPAAPLPATERGERSAPIN